jgi:hypothetical protein
VADVQDLRGLFEMLRNGIGDCIQASSAVVGRCRTPDGEARGAGPNVPHRAWSLGSEVRY